MQPLETKISQLEKELEELKTYGKSTIYDLFPRHLRIPTARLKYRESLELLLKTLLDQRNRTGTELTPITPLSNNNELTPSK